MAGAVIASAAPVEDGIVRAADIMVAAGRAVVITAVQGRVAVDPAPAADRMAAADPAAGADRAAVVDLVVVADLVVATGAKQLLPKRIARCNRKRWHLTVPPLLFCCCNFVLLQ